ncbi:MAG: VCBS repeat-containing protein [Acidobacteria bacterium]|nr:VCBS repeat-containing protein [Acidobacteriota bacterium]
MSVLAARSPEPRFREHTIGANLKFGYQLAAADLNGDGKTDLIAVDERATELAWYENPGWQRHVIAADVPRTINVDCADSDGDGALEIAILYRFESRPEKSEGIVSLLSRDGDPRRPWKAREIDRVPTAHRVRWAYPEGSRRPVMVMAPMVGLKAEPPDYQAPVPMYLYRPGVWKRELISDRLRGVLHSIYPVDWDGDGRQELLTASFLGLRLFRLAPDGAWSSSPIAQGAPDPCPKCGSSEVVLGRLGQRRFLAAIEPWHGDQVAIYRERRDIWLRKVIDDSFQNGHALAAGDLDHDGRDEVVAGYRGKGFQLYYYRALDPAGERWQRQTLDAGGIAAADCKIRDLNGDGRPDVVCIGASTGNVKWYENLAP